MRLVYLSTSIIPSRTANSIHVMRMCDSFTRQGYAVTLYVRPSENPEQDDFIYYGVKQAFAISKVPEVKAVIPTLGALLHAKRVRSLVLNQPKPDILYGRYLFALCALATENVPLYYESHSPPDSRLRYLLEASLFRVRHFRRLVVISQALKDLYLQRFPILDAECILVAHDAADDPGPTIPIPVVAARANRPQIGYVGHLYAGRGIEVIVELAKRLPAYDFKVVGGAAEDIQRWSQAAKPNNLTFVGFVPPGEVGRYIAAFDVVLAPYQRSVMTHGKRDTVQWMSPLKIFENMAYSKALIASDLLVLREVLQDGENSLLCPPDDMDCWENAVRRLVENPTLRASLGRKAHADFVQHYTWQKRAERVLS